MKVPDAMPLDLVTIPCRADNYAFLLHSAETGETALIDAPDSAPIQAELDARGWQLNDILITHHHDDHIAGISALRQGARVIGAAADAHRLPDLDVAVSENDTVTVCGEVTRVIDVSGHTIGHIAFHMADSRLLFTADSLMAMGCGRLFEGTPAQMWNSMLKLRDLPPDTTVCSGHEYTETNAAFALTLEPCNSSVISRLEAVRKIRAAGQFTVPSSLETERNTNPYLRADDPALAAAIGMAGADAVAVFAEIRTRKDRF